MGERIAKLFVMEEGAAIPTIKELPARSNCQHPPTHLALAGHESKASALEARVQALEVELRDRNTQLEDRDRTASSDTPRVEAGSIQAIGSKLQTIERKLATIEPTPTPGPDGSSRTATTGAGPPEEPKLTRTILRQEINKSLAAAMIGMAGLLGSADNGGA